MLGSRQSAMDLLVRGEQQTVSFPLYSTDGKTLLKPSAGTFTLFDPKGTKLVDAQPVIVDTGVAQYVLDLSDDATLGDRYQERWVLTVDGKDQTFIRSAGVGLWRPWVPVTEFDLTEGRHRNLDEVLQDAKRETLGDYIQEAVRVFQADLVANGKFWHRLLDPEVTRLPIVYKALELLFNDAATNEGRGYEKQRDRYEKLYTQAWGVLIGRFDEVDENGLPDESEKPQTARRASVLTTWDRGF